MDLAPVERRVSDRQVFSELELRSHRLNRRVELSQQSLWKTDSDIYVTFPLGVEISDRCFHSQASADHPLSHLRKACLQESVKHKRREVFVCERSEVQANAVRAREAGEGSPFVNNQRIVIHRSWLVGFFLAFGFRRCRKDNDNGSGCEKRTESGNESHDLSPEFLRWVKAAFFVIPADRGRTVSGRLAGVSYESVFGDFTNF